MYAGAVADAETGADAAQERIDALGLGPDGGTWPPDPGSGADSVKAASVSEDAGGPTPSEVLPDLFCFLQQFFIIFVTNSCRAPLREE